MECRGPWGHDIAIDTGTWGEGSHGEPGRTEGVASADEMGVTPSWLIPPGARKQNAVATWSRPPENTAREDGNDVKRCEYLPGMSEEV